MVRETTGFFLANSSEIGPPISKTSRVYSRTPPWSVSLEGLAVVFLGLAIDVSWALAFDLASIAANPAFDGGRYGGSRPARVASVNATSATIGIMANGSRTAGRRC